MILVSFCFENPSSIISDTKTYVERICNQLQLDGLILKFIDINGCDACCQNAINNVEDEIWICDFKQEYSGKSFDFQLSFVFETYKHSSHLSVGISSNNYIPTPDDIYLEQLKLNIKTQLKREWEKIVWLVDKDSACLSSSLYPDIYNVENLARQLINDLLTKEYGIYWWEKFVSSAINDKYLSRYSGYKTSVPSFNNVDEKLLSIDILDLKSIFTSKTKRWNPEPDTEVDRYLSNLISFEKLNIEKKLQDKAVVEIDLWKEQFSKYLPEEFISDFQSFSTDRNHVVHNKLLDRNIYGKVKSMANKLTNNLEEALKKVYEVVKSKEERERIAYEEKLFYEELKLSEKAMQEAEANVRIRTTEEILEFCNDYIEHSYELIKDQLRYRSDIEISEFQRMSYIDKTGILFTVSHKIVEKNVRITYKSQYIDDGNGANSEIYLFINDDPSKQILITYTNGDLKFDEESSSYMPTTQDDIFANEDIVLFVLNFVQENFENLREKVDANKFRIYKDGDSSPVADIPCCNCGEHYICVNEEYAPFGTCLNCGEFNEIVECSRCSNYFEGVADDDGLAFCENCKDYFDKQ